MGDKNLADIFISYKSDRRYAAQHLSKILELNGYTVWFDYALLSGTDFGLQIEDELRAAKVVIVLWCSRSRQSRWVREEADLATKLHTFTPVWLERVDLPLGFARADTIDLTIWDGAPRSNGLDRLLDEIARRVGRDPTPSSRELKTYEQMWRSFGALRLKDFPLIPPVLPEGELSDEPGDSETCKRPVDSSEPKQQQSAAGERADPESVTPKFKGTEDDQKPNPEDNPAPKVNEPQSTSLSHMVRYVGGAAVVVAGIALVWALASTPHQRDNPSTQPFKTAGQLIVEAPATANFSGPQGGPFSPASRSFKLTSAGPGFRWSIDQTLPEWLSVTPSQGDLALNGSVDVAAALTAAAHSLSEGRHDLQLVFKNFSTGDITKQSVTLTVSAKPPSPPPITLQSYPAAFDPLSLEREQALKPRDTFRECATCPEMIVVPTGRFTMGSPNNEAIRGADEGQQHVVTFARQFAVGRFAVTFDEWDACLADGGCNGHSPSDQNWGRGMRPVILVNWADAKAYVGWLSRKTGKAYRLLSEAEREYVTRAGTTTPFWFGNAVSLNQANYGGADTYSLSKSGFPKQQTIPVNNFLPNPWGLYQVHGNVREWTEDCYNASYAGAPSDGSPWLKGDCNRRVTRNGSWVNMSALLRSAFRGNIAASDLRSGTIGFRVARSL